VLAVLASAIAGTQLLPIYMLHRLGRFLATDSVLPISMSPGATINKLNSQKEYNKTNDITSDLHLQGSGQPNPKEDIQHEASYCHTVVLRTSIPSDWTLLHSKHSWLRESAKRYLKHEQKLYHVLRYR
jgi:hypothetical protein